VSSATVAQPAPAPSEDARAQAVARIRGRLLSPMPADRVLGWVLPLLVTAAAGLLRFWHLTRPPGPTLRSSSGLVFDEVYYAHDSFMLLRHGVETSNDCHHAGIGVCPEFIAHPPLGKWMMAFGEWLFDHGRTAVIMVNHKPEVFPASTLSFRFSAALCGTLAVLMIARIARRLFRSTALGCVAGLLLGLDGLEFVESRTGLLDIFILFWVVAAFGALLIDRDHVRQRLAARIDGPLTESDWRPWLGVRPWRWVAGLCIGAATAVKWSGGYYIPALLLLAIVWDWQARRICYEATRVRPVMSAALWVTLAQDLTYSLLPLVVLPAAVYLASWTGWFLSDGAHAYDHDWAVRSGQGTLGHFWAVLRGWWHYQGEIWGFSKNLTTATSGHPYLSRPWGWLLLARPIAYFYNGSFSNPTAACGASTCSQEVLAIGNPAIWWVSIGAFVACLWRWLGRGDGRGLTILLPFLAGYLPWCWLDLHLVDGGRRVMFFYYMVPEVPFMVLAVTFAVGLVLGMRDRPRSAVRRHGGLAIATAYLGVVIGMFVFFYPVLAAKPIPYDAYRHRIWFNQCGEKSQKLENAPCWF
jgi:dolichyl-phosphate-mannose-protein mannosyltransferase